MAIFTRFECPRCQHIFVLEGDADAFADCPKCQSMALAIGGATGGGTAAPAAATKAPSLASEEGSSPLAMDLEDLQGDGPEQRAIPSGEGAPTGVFSGLLSANEAPTEGFPDATSSNLQVAAALDQRGLPKEFDADDDDAGFDDPTMAAELPQSLISASQRPPEEEDEEGFDPFAALAEAAGDDEDDDVTLAATEVLRPASLPDGGAAKGETTEVLKRPFAMDELDDAFDLPHPDSPDGAVMNSAPAPAATAPASVSQELAAGTGDSADDESADDDEDAWEHGPPASVPTLAAPLPAPPGQMPSRPSNAAVELTRQADPAEATASGDDFSLELHEEGDRREVGPGERQGVWDPNFSSGEFEPPAVLLRDLEAQMDGSRDLRDASNNLSTDEIFALEAAFDQVAGQPSPRAEEALRQASFDAAHSLMEVPTRSQLQGSAVPAPPGANEPPSVSRRRRTGHLTLSEETKALAGIAIAPEAGSHNLALDLTRMNPAEAASPERQVRPTEPQAPAQAPEPPHEVTQPVARSARARPEGAHAAPPPAEPSVLRGFTPLRVAAAVSLFLLVGLGAGAAVAPEPARKPTTPRALAEQRFAQGNRFYDQGRFDDALGSYRGALSIDRTYAPAVRAKAVALAKQARHDEAASAYRAYLEIAPAAADAADVREVLAAYEGGAAR